MQYFTNLNKEVFYYQPQPISDSDINDLRYAVGANLYMNGLMDIFNKIIKGLDFVGSITICFEDGIREVDLERCEENTINLFRQLNEYDKRIGFKGINIPLIFIRVRSIEQFKVFVSKLKPEYVRYLTGFTFPKFESTNGEIYLEILRKLNCHFNKIFYAMPILESKAIINKESRVQELLTVQQLLTLHRDIVLNVRVGGADFSSAYGLRRSVSSTIYDIRVVSDCLIDIINIFGRSELEFVISGPVWEYFSSEFDSLEVKGLLDEIRRDKENGFHGKTSIHPTQVKYINLSYIVTYEEYMDAKKILDNATEGGVFKGEGGNKMNEIGPHLNWSKQILRRANIFGVLKEGLDIDTLFSVI